MGGFGFQERRALRFHGHRFRYRSDFQASVLGDHIYLQCDGTAHQLFEARGGEADVVVSGGR